MDALKQRLQNCEEASYEEEKSFIPYESLCAILTQDEIHQAFLEDSIELENARELAEDIPMRARKIFAILVLCDAAMRIRDFFQRDKLQGSDLDQTLPFEKLEQLKAILPAAEAELFFKTQWRVEVPIFAGRLINRRLAAQSCMPFTESAKLGGGGFGEVYAIVVHQDHWQYTEVASSELVRKEISLQKNPEVEHRNLTTLRNTRHSNIVEMLGSYTRGEHQNLIFRKVAGCGLDKIFEGEAPFPFPEGQLILTALARLASAISVVHDFSAKDSPLVKNGFHHDIKPGNILVDDNTFILSDFGLSRFKDPNPVEETSSFQQHVPNHYMAPECINFSDTSEKRFVHRSSDIWSLGCIILELMVYVTGAAQEVEAFRKERRYVIPKHIRYDFHEAGKPSTNVQKRLSRFEDQVSSNGIDSKTFKALASVVKALLNHEPTQRPKAPTVEFGLCCISLAAKLRQVSSLYEVVMQNDLFRLSTEAYIEEVRFQSLRWAINICDFSSFEVSDTTATEHRYITEQFLTLLKFLDGKEQVLQSLRQLERPKNIPVFSKIRELNSEFWNLLPEAVQMKADLDLRRQLLSAEEPSRLQDLSDVLNEHPGNDQLADLLTMRKLERELESKDHPSQAKLDPIPVLDPEPSPPVLDGKRTRRLHSSTEPERRVLIEFKSYQNWNDRIDEFQDRITSFVQLLQHTAAGEKLHTLRPLGFFHNLTTRSLGIAYNFPDTKEQCQVVSLQSLLQDYSRNRDAIGPSLSSRFLLARQLASSVYSLHTVFRWVHKSVSSFNIVFFPESSKPKLLPIDLNPCIAEPYLIGFEHSRPNDEEAFSSKLEQKYQEYHHPDFNDGSRYQLGFDYYSVGIVLLEIALWKPMVKLTKKIPKGTWSERRDMLLNFVRNELEFNVGPIYRDVVIACLSIDASQAPDELMRIYQDKVIAALGRLNV